MLRITDIELELISDTNMHLFIEKGMRGGISYIAKRHSKANNKYMQSYNVNEPSKLHIWNQIIYMVRQWVNICLLVDLSG